MLNVSEIQALTTEDIIGVCFFSACLDCIQPNTFKHPKVGPVFKKLFLASLFYEGDCHDGLNVFF